MFAHRNTRNFGIYEPRQQLSDALAMSSHERVKQRMLDLQREMEVAMQEFMQYQMIGKVPSLALEKLQSKILELFITCRPHIENYLRKEAERAKKVKKEEERQYRLSNIDNKRQTYNKLTATFENLYRQKYIQQETMYEMITFLVQFIYDVGVSRIEMPEKDPLKEFSNAAFGEDYTGKLDGTDT